MIGCIIYVFELVMNMLLVDNNLLIEWELVVLVEVEKGLFMKMIVVNLYLLVGMICNYLFVIFSKLGVYN